MQYILTEHELNMGYEIIESWKEERVPLNELYARQKRLNHQGYFTLTECVDDIDEIYEIRVFEKVK
jgi:hypothetical protein